MTIGERIRQRREELGISQTALADAVNSTKQNIYKYETGAITNIPSDKIEQIAAVLHVTPSYLMGWSASPAKTETSTPEGDGSLESDEFLKIYARLSPAKQSLVQSLVRELSSAEEQADDSQD